MHLKISLVYKNINMFWFSAINSFLDSGVYTLTFVRKILKHKI